MLYATFKTQEGDKGPVRLDSRDNTLYDISDRIAHLLTSDDIISHLLSFLWYNGERNPKNR